VLANAGKCGQDWPRLVSQRLATADQTLLVQCWSRFTGELGAKCVHGVPEQPASSHVSPHMHLTFLPTCMAGRWVGRTVIDVMLAELPIAPEATRRAFDHGLVTLQRTQRSAPAAVGPEHKLCLNEVIIVVFHRHEPAVRCSHPSSQMSKSDARVMTAPSPRSLVARTARFLLLEN